MTLDSSVANYGIKKTLTISQSESVGYLITEMTKNRFRRFPVVDSEQNPIGMVTSTDVLGALHQSGHSSFLNLSIEEIMSDRIIIKEVDSTLRETIDLMYNIGISGVPIVDDDEIVGIITEKDFLLIDQIWKEIPDVAISDEDGPGRPVTPKSVVTHDFTFWQVADKLINLAQRQVLVKHPDDRSYTGVITIMTLLNSLVKTLTFSDPNFDQLQNLTVSNLITKPLFQRAVPMLVSSARLWMNSRGIEAFPLFSRGDPVKLITEKDLIGYLANHIQ